MNRKTLLKQPSSRLHHILDGTESVVLEGGKVIHLDRRGETFRYVVEYLRGHCNTDMLGDEGAYNATVKEMAYWNMSVQAFEEECPSSFRVKQERIREPTV